MASRGSECVTFVQFAAIVSLSLGLTNLLPAPLLTMAICCFMRSRRRSSSPLGQQDQRVRRPAGGMLLLRAVRRRQRSASDIRVVIGFEHLHAEFLRPGKEHEETRGFWTLSGLQQSRAGVPCPGEQREFLCRSRELSSPNRAENGEIRRIGRERRFC